MVKNTPLKLAAFLLAALVAAALSSCNIDFPATGSDLLAESGDTVTEPGESHEKSPAEKPSAMLHPRNPAPGDFTLLAVGPSPAGTEVKLETGLPLTVSPPFQDDEYTYFILVAGFQVLPGSYALILSLESPDGIVRQLEETLEVSYFDFERQSFSMPPGLTDSWPQQQMVEEAARVNHARLHTEAYPLWHQPFIPPLEGRVSSRYGTVRFIDQRPPSHHAGIDFAVPTGTPVKATNDGVVRLAASLLAYGNIVIIDHGLNLSSSYLHLDTMTVMEGDRVSRSQVIGTVGTTGYSLGPHLHWEVNLDLSPVNPLQLTRGDLYYLPTPAVSR